MNPYAKLALWTVIWAAISFAFLSVASAGVFILPFAFVMVPGGWRRNRPPSAARHAAVIVAGLTAAIIGLSNLDQSDAWIWPAMLAGGIALSIAAVMSYRNKLRRFEEMVPRPGSSRGDRDRRGPAQFAWMR
ncbi:MAG TPA: hypothetical protein VGO97_00900 [Solirubrobacterales bacterium]|jgi:hypothetical protein|nr:hypothetical protein [Solirubrobacterales bacterium]